MKGAMDDCFNTHEAHSLHKQFSNCPSIIQGTLDSGSSGDFLNKNSPQQNVKKQTTPLETKQPDGQKSVSKHKSELKIPPELEAIAIPAEIIPSK